MRTFSPESADGFDLAASLPPTAAFRYVISDVSLRSRSRSASGCPISGPSPCVAGRYVALGQAPLTAWDALVQLTIEQNAAFLLLAGDICDGAERAVPAQMRLLNGLQRLAAHGIRTFIVRGSSDPADRWMGIHHWPDARALLRCARRRIHLRHNGWRASRDDPRNQPFQRSNHESSGAIQTRI